MKLEHERKMFLHAVQHLIDVQSVWKFTAPWMDTVVSPDVHLTLGWPRDSRFRHHAAVAWCLANDAEAYQVASDSNPQGVIFKHGYAFFLYEDGYDVMAGSGALAAVRREAESAVLQ